ncbi:hypothetical protein WM41_0908 [Corynebacterium simulans]|uniref:Uncharacterized protein n=1 Tax=Corynebacterium simulans TaxID=146827 RepID=A0ABR5V9S1_9CORY|nr:hypothetical protein WM41_0908 [Corynebacterium simulans]
MSIPPGLLKEVLALNVNSVDVWRTRDYLVALAEKEGIEIPAFIRLLLYLSGFHHQ